MNWAGVPLRSFETIVRYIAGTATAAGLRVAALLKRGGNETGGAGLGRGDAAAPPGAARRLPGVEIHAAATNQLERGMSI